MTSNTLKINITTEFILFQILEFTELKLFITIKDTCTCINVVIFFVLKTY